MIESSAVQNKWFGIGRNWSKNIKKYDFLTNSRPIPNPLSWTVELSTISLDRAEKTDHDWYKLSAGSYVLSKKKRHL